MQKIGLIMTNFSTIIIEGAFSDIYITLMGMLI